MIAFLLGLISQSFAAENSVYVAPFFSVDSAAEETADRIPGILLEYMAKEPKIDGLGVVDMKPVHDMSAELYITSCPPAEFVGCAFVLAESSEVPYAVVGTVTALEEGARVDITIIEIETAREALELKLDMAVGGEEAFAAAVSRAVIGLMEGTIGEEEDLRISQSEEGYNEDEAQAIDDYTRESGGAEAVQDKVDVELEQKVITEEDLKYMMAMEGSKEWDRLGMSPREYMRYFNSGMSLGRWKQLSNGRKGQLITRLGLGLERGPINGKYYGRIAKSNLDLSPVDSYAWQTIDTANGFDAAASISYGLFPFLDVGVIGGVTAGSFELDIHSFVINQHSAVPPSTKYPQTTTYVGSQVVYTPSYFKRIKPVVGGEVIYWFAGEKKFDFGAEAYPTLPSATYITVGGLFGGEMKFNEFLDIYAHIPLGVVIVSSNSPVDYQQNGGVLSLSVEDDNVAKVEAPVPFSRVSTGINLGVQIRIPVIKPRTHGLEMYE
jgi:hypothetical protein